MSIAPPNPFSWRADAKKAVVHGEMRSLYLVPLLINMPVWENLGSPAHTVVRYSQLEMIGVLH